MEEKINHIAIIMDGNGRWAEEKGKNRSFGHKKGVEALRSVIVKANELGIKHLTVYAFSTENWNRPKFEVDFLMRLLVEYIKKEVKSLHKENVRITTIGSLDRFKKNIRDTINKAKETTKDNTGLNFNIAINYGSRDEIIRAINNLINKNKENNIECPNIDESNFNKLLDTQGIKDPDLLIRTGGERRISNFLLWQIAYTELYFTDTYWPDFTGEDLEIAIEDYKKRNRRFGSI